MKLDKSRRSKNVEDRSRDTSATAFKSNPNQNPALMRVTQSRNKEAVDSLKRARDGAKKMGRKNPMYESLKGMDREFKRAKTNPRGNTKNPIPTPRPTPDKNYKHPKLWRY